MDRLARLCRSLTLLALPVALVPALAAGQAGPPEGSPASPARIEKTVQAPSFGTSGTTYYRQAFSEFFPGQSDESFTSLGGANFGRYGSNILWGTQPHLPGGALLTYVELDFCDTTSTNQVVLELYECSFLGDCGSGPLATLTSGVAEAPGCSWVSADLEPLNYTINNYTRQLTPFVDALGSDRYLTGVVYGYKLQVRQAPATPSFNDVPVDHQFFRYVEALVNSGITAGCGSGNFCPNTAVTRGQMAAFLSIALGLNWSQ